MDARAICSVFALGAVLVVGSARAQAPVPPAAAAPTPAPAGGVQALVQTNCVGCHAASVISAKGRTPAEWSDVLDRMVSYGVTASDADMAQIKDYLVATYPKT